MTSLNLAIMVRNRTWQLVIGLLALALGSVASFTLLYNLASDTLVVIQEISNRSAMTTRLLLGVKDAQALAPSRLPQGSYPALQHHHAQFRELLDLARQLEPRFLLAENRQRMRQIRETGEGYHHALARYMAWLRKHDEERAGLVDHLGRLSSLLTEIERTPPATGPNQSAAPSRHALLGEIRHTITNLRLELLEFRFDRPAAGPAGPAAVHQQLTTLTGQLNRLLPQQHGGKELLRLVSATAASVTALTASLPARLEYVQAIDSALSSMEETAIAIGNSLQQSQISLQREFDRNLLWTVILVSIVVATITGALIALLFSTIVKRLSDQERQQRELAQLARSRQEEAERANRAKSEFLAMMSHEIRTPMNAVLGMGELLWEEPLTERQRHFVHIMRTAGETLVGVINDVLDMSKLEAGHLVLEQMPFDLGRLVEDQCEIFAPTAHAKGLELICTVSSQLPPRFIGDELRIRQVLTNLLANAIKFTETGSIRVSCTSQPVDDGASQVQLSVQDTGIGIPGDRIPDIFTPFTQMDSSFSRRHGGTGLGLTICQRLTTLMGGRIEAESREGEGSTFTIRLPLPTHGLPMAPVPTVPLLRGRRVMVVDDVTDNRLIVTELLQSLEAEVLEASSGAEALSRLKGLSEQVDLLILDLRMPGMDGFQVVEAMHHAGFSGIPMLMLTSDNRSEDIALCQQLGIRHYLIKPIRRAELARIIHDALANGTPVCQLRELPQEPKAGASVLLVEDAEATRLLVGAFFANTPHRLSFAENGMEGLKRMQKEEFDLVFMDIQMPMMDGLEATRHFRSWERTHGDERHLPIIAFTAHVLEEDVQASLTAGCDRHLGKPAGKRKLIGLVEEYLAKRKTAQSR